jgi:hypothetical protein
VFQHYLLAQDGVFLLIGAHHVTVRGATFHNIAANFRSNQLSSHLFYVSRGSHDIELDDLVAYDLQAADEPGAAYQLGAGLHVYTGGSGASVYNVTARGWTISNCGWALVFRNHTTGVAVDGWTVTDCGHGGVPAAVDFGYDNTGSYRNLGVSASIGTPLIRGIMTDGGGNILD